MRDKPLQDWEYPEPDDGDGGDEFDLRPCPKCGEEIYDDAERCPYCESYIARTEGSEAEMQGKPVWYILLALAGVIAVIIAFGWW